MTFRAEAPTFLDPADQYVFGNAHASRNPTLGSGTFTGSGAGEWPEFGPVLQPQMPQRLQSTRSANL